MPILVVLEAAKTHFSLKVVDNQGELALDLYVCPIDQQPPEVVVVRDVVRGTRRSRFTGSTESWIL